MITVHHLENSRSQRILWLLEELGLDYEIKHYKRLPTMLAPPELKAVHPLGKSPVITDRGRTLAETGAIIDYLLETYGEGRLIPARGSDERLDFTFWLHFAEGSAMTPLLLKLITNAMPKNAPMLVRPLVKAIADKLNERLVTRQIADQLAFYESSLARTGWFAGPELTAADIMMSFPLELAVARAGAGAKTNVARFLAAIHARPAYRQALERGGPYVYA